MTGNETWTAEQVDALDRLRSIRDDMQSAFVSRDKEINGLCVALLARTNMLLLGPPGTAKSLLSTEFGKAIGCRRQYQRLLGAFSVPDEVFGPFNPALLLEGKYERNVEGYLPDAEFAYLDEIFNANQELLTTMNTVLNERQFDQGTQRIKCPLVMAVGAANVYPEGDLAMAALYDRFLVRYWTPYVTDRNEKLRLLRIGRDGGVHVRASLQAGDVALVQEAARAVEVPDSILSQLLDIEEALRAEGYTVSDRRAMKQLDLLKAQAALHGRAKVEADDLFILADSLWDKHEDRTLVWRCVAKVINSGLLAARTLFDSVVLEFNDINLTDSDAAGSQEYRKARAGMIARINDCSDEISTIATSQPSDQIHDLLVKLAGMKKKVGRAIAKYDMRVRLSA